MYHIQDYYSNIIIILGDIWFLTLLMAAALDKDPVALEQEHLNTMKFLYGPHFEQGFAHVQQLPHCPNLRMSSVSVKRVKKSFYCQAPGPGLDQPGP